MWPTYSQTYMNSLYSLLNVSSKKKYLLLILEKNKLRLKQQAQLILLCFAIVHFKILLYTHTHTHTLKVYSNFALSKSTIFWARCHFSHQNCSLCASISYFGNSHSISNFFIIIFVRVICDQWSLMLLLQKDEPWMIRDEFHHLP